MDMKIKERVDLVRPPGFELTPHAQSDARPGSAARQAAILDQARLRPPRGMIILREF